MSNPSIQGLQDAQRANLRHVAAMKPSGAFGRVVQDVTVAVHRYVTGITHVDTGALRASHRVSVSGLRGEISLDAAAVNPRSGSRVSIYGPVEHARGGSHAFYYRAEHEYGTSAVLAGASAFAAELR